MGGGKPLISLIELILRKVEESTRSQKGLVDIRLILSVKSVKISVISG
jgi:hypothetical protein